MSRKNLLKETTIARFMTLAGNSKHAGKFLKENMDPSPSVDPDNPDPMPPMEEGSYDENFLEALLAEEEPMDDEAPAGGMPSPEAPMSSPDDADAGLEGDAEEEPLTSMPDEEAAGPEGEASFSQADVAAISAVIPVLQSIDSASKGGSEADPGADAMADAGPVDDPDAGLDAGPAPGAVADADPDAGLDAAAPDDEVEKMVSELLNKGKLNRLTNEVYKRVAKRIIKEKAL